MLNESYNSLQCNIHAYLARERDREHLVFISKEKSLVVAHTTMVELEKEMEAIAKAWSSSNALVGV